MNRWTVRDVMSTGVVSVREEATYREIVDLMEVRGVGALPVLDSCDRVVGIVTESDLLSKVRYAGSAHDAPLLERHDHREERTKALAAIARELMSTPATTVLPTTTVVHVARLMAELKLKRMPVVNDLGRLVGIVAGRDLLKVFLRADTEIRADVRECMFGRLDALLDVDVVDGVVTLAGELERRSEIPVAVTLAERVDGVVAVTERLTFRADDTHVPHHPGPLAAY
jgi:CBS domain-containing protein